MTGNGGAPQSEGKDPRLEACGRCPARDLGLCPSLQQEPGLPLETGFARARRKLCHQGEAASHVFILCDGWAFRFVTLADGRRQILDFLLPGQLTSTAAPFSDYHEASVQTLTPVRYARIERQKLLSTLRERDHMLLRLTELCVADIQRLQDCIADLGRRTAMERVARLLLGLYERLEMRGAVEDHAFEFPLRQEHMADALGLTPIHVGRMLRQLRTARIIRLQARQLQLLDLAALREAADGGLESA